MTDVLAGSYLAIRGWFLALMLWPVSPADAGGRDVAVVMRAEVPVYARFAEVLRAACDCSARVVAIDGDDRADEGRIADAVRALRPGAVVAVGRSGLRFAVARLADLPLVHALALHPEALLPPALGGAPGAPLDVDPEGSLALLRRLAPRVRTVGVIHDPRHTDVTGVARAARDLGLALRANAVTDVAGAVRAAAEALAEVPAGPPGPPGAPAGPGAPGPVDAILLLPDRTTAAPDVLDHLLLAGLERRIPVIGFADRHVRRGALLAHTAPPDLVAVETARLVERVLAGDRRPALGRRRLSLALNLRTAARLGLIVPDDVARSADLLVR